MGLNLNGARLALRIQWDEVTGRYCSAIRAKRIEKKVMLLIDDIDFVTFQRWRPK
jgi:hypothetical protein